MISLAKSNNADAVVNKFLKSLGTPISSKSIVAELDRHPDYPSLLAISDVLANFKIESKALHIAADELDTLPYPFIVFRGGGNFLVVHDISEHNVTVSDENWEKHKLGKNEFAKLYAGVVLVAEASQADQTPHGSRHLLNNIKHQIIATALVLIVLSLLIFHTNFINVLSWQLVTLTFVKTAGLITAILLLIQAIDENNPLVQVVCNAGGRKSDCHAILSSKAAQAFWGLTWSDIGFFYFTATWLLTLFGGDTTFIFGVLFFLNVISLPYTFYSIYYQARTAKQWCILCCTVQGLLWLEFIPLISYQNFISFSLGDIEAGAIITVFVCLLSPVVIWTLLKPLLLKVQQLQPLKEQLRKFRYNTELFNLMLTSQPKYAQPRAEWSIVLGNKEATNVITMISNPYCPPCSKTHKLLDELLEERTDLQARIIFTPNKTNNQLRIQTCRHLVALIDLTDETQIKQALNDWYNQKQKNYEKWAKLYPAVLDEAVSDKMDRQKDWCEMAQVSYTPTMLINGYRLPELYQLTDLKYMLE